MAVQIKKTQHPLAHRLSFHRTAASHSRQNMLPNVPKLWVDYEYYTGPKKKPVKILVADASSCTAHTEIALLKLLMLIASVNGGRSDGCSGYFPTQQTPPCRPIR